jgi:hypothetical protein
MSQMIAIMALFLFVYKFGCYVWDQMTRKSLSDKIENPLRNDRSKRLSVIVLRSTLCSIKSIRQSDDHRKDLKKKFDLSGILEIH